MIKKNAPSQDSAGLSTGLAALRISGADRAEFLQGQLTQDVHAVTPDRPALAGWTSAKGRLLLVGWLLNWADSYWLLVPAEVAASSIQRLKMFVLRAQVSIEIAPVGVSFDPLPEAVESSSMSKESHVYDCKIDNLFYSFVPSAAHQGRLRVTATAGITAAADAAAEVWRVANLRAGLPSVFAATREHFVPQMLNLDLLGGISFTKGCYVGQEIVARTQNLGRIKRRMYGFVATQPTAPGASVFGDGKAIGEVVDAESSGSETLVLAVIRIAELASCSKVSLEADGNGPLERRPLPYAVPEALDE